MEFWNISIPALIFVAPIAALLYTYLGTPYRSGGESRVALALSGVLLLAALAGIIRFDDSVRLEFVLPLSTEPSGYFAFILQLRWTRFVWIFFASSALAALAGIEGKAAFASDKRGVKFGFLAGSSFFSSLAFLSENVILSLIFLEITFFFLHSFLIRGGVKEGKNERVSFFKRNVFIVMSLLALLAMSALGAVKPGSILILGSVLYILAFIFSRWNFSNWNQLPISLIQASLVFFLLGRVIREDLPMELWQPLSVVFAVLASVFSAFSIFSVSAIASSFWMLYAVVGYTLFIRLGSGKPEELFWGTSEAIALFSVFSLTCLFRTGRKATKSSEKAVSYLMAAAILGVITGAIPGIDLVTLKAASENPARLIGGGVLAFLLSVMVGKSLMVCFSQEEEGYGNDPSFLYGILPGIFLFLLNAAAVVKITDIYGENPFRLGAAYLMANPYIVVTGSALLAGLLSGLLLGANSRFISRMGRKEKRMDDYFPSLDPFLSRWNENISLFPTNLNAKIAEKVTGLYRGFSGTIQEVDRVLFSEGVFTGVRKYGGGLSHLIRYFHSGNVRVYLFLGVCISLLAAAVFLLEGQ